MKFRPVHILGPAVFVLTVGTMALTFLYPHALGEHKWAWVGDGDWVRDYAECRERSLVGDMFGPRSDWKTYSALMRARGWNMQCSLDGCIELRWKPRRAD